MYPRAVAGEVSSARVDYDTVWNEVYGDIQDVGPVHRHLRRIVRRTVAALDYDSVLDVGCGAGHHLPLLCANRTLNRVTGVDVSPEALRRAREAWPTGDFHELDVERERLYGTWDLVFSALLLEHVADDERALEHMRAMTGRHLLVCTIAGNFERYRPWEEQMGHVRNYRRGELEAKLERAGFRVTRAIYWGFPFYTPLARTLQNRMKSEASFSVPTRALAEVLYGLYFLNSSKRGDLLVVLASAA